MYSSECLPPLNQPRVPPYGCMCVHACAGAGVYVRSCLSVRTRGLARVGTCVTSRVSCVCVLFRCVPSVWKATADKTVDTMEALGTLLSVRSFIPILATLV